MRDIVDGLAAWRSAGHAFALATVVRTHGSAPRPPGAAMAVDDRGEVLGSVSGGCVEAAVHAAAEEVLRTGRARTQTYGETGDDAFAPGLTCGGTIEVLIRPHTALTAVDRVIAAVRTGRPVATVSIESAQLVVWPPPTGSGGAPGGPAGAGGSDGVRVEGGLGDRGLDAAAAAVAARMLAAGGTGAVRVRGVPVFVQSYPPPPRMIVFGAIDFAGAVARIGRFLGYHVTVCDARGAFVTRPRLPEADELVVDWPHRYLATTAVDERTVLCVLTHDPKFDVPLIEAALRTPARYIGVMGSRRSHDARIRRLRVAGVTPEQLARLSAPIGLDLGARTPEETAVSIAAEIVARSGGGSGLPLTGLPTPIHRPG